MLARGAGLGPPSRCRNGAFNATPEVGRRVLQTDEIGLSEICEAIASDLTESRMELEARKRKIWATSTASTQYSGSDNQMPTFPGVRFLGCKFWPNRTWVGFGAAAGLRGRRIRYPKGIHHPNPR